MIVDANKLVGSVEDVQLVTVGDLLTLDRAAGLQDGLEEFKRRYPSQMVGSTPTSTTHLGCGKAAVFTYG